MKTKLIPAITIAAVLGSASLFAGPSNLLYSGMNDAPRRVYVMPATAVKCDTMSIAAPMHQGGTTSVSCKNYAGIRPDDCRRACAGR